MSKSMLWEHFKPYNIAHSRQELSTDVKACLLCTIANIKVFVMHKELYVISCNSNGL